MKTKQPREEMDKESDGRKKRRRKGKGEKIASEGSCKREEASGDAKTALGYAGQFRSGSDRQSREGEGKKKKKKNWNWR